MVGQALVRAFSNSENLVYPITRQLVNLLDRNDTYESISDISPDLVIDAAAKVGGIGANNSFPVDFLQENLSIQNNLMGACHKFGVKKFIFLGSSCIYPRNSEQPIREESLLTGQLEATNSAYAIAKIAGLELVKSYRRQYSRDWISVMPTNLYGPGDNFSVSSSHVVPAMIRKFIEAKEKQLHQVVLWGSGKPIREFLHVEDLANAIMLLNKVYNEEQHINVGSGKEISILQLALLVSNLVGYNGKIIWDIKMPDGTPRKVLDSSKVFSLGWTPHITLESGIESTISWFIKARASGDLRL